MATLLKVLNNLADIKSAGVLHFASELRTVRTGRFAPFAPPMRNGVRGGLRSPFPNARVSSIAITNIILTYSKFSCVFDFQKILRAGNKHAPFTLQWGKPIPK